jgi:hypothetical protein
MHTSKKKARMTRAFLWGLLLLGSFQLHQYLHQIGSKVGQCSNCGAGEMLIHIAQTSLTH